MKGNLPAVPALLTASPYHVTGEYSLREAEAWCANLAKKKYENFLVGTLFVPRELRQHFYNVYAYCRVADDLGDESGGAANSLPLLDWWNAELDSCYSGSPQHPVFVALAGTNQQFGIPKQPYADLLRAFRQDQTTARYATYQDLLGYCRYSANPVGRLVLYLCGYSDDVRQRLSDATCSALQLANFWQDVVRDYAIGRVYIPAEDMLRFGVHEAQIEARTFTPSFKALMQFECGRTRALFMEGAELGSMVHARARLDIEMFSRGGLEVLNLIARQGYDVLTKRPVISKGRQLTMLAQRLLLGMVRHKRGASA